MLNEIQEWNIHVEDYCEVQEEIKKLVWIVIGIKVVISIIIFGFREFFYNFSFCRNFDLKARG